MPKENRIPSFSFSWLTTSHDEHPYGDILWHLFWGIVIGASILYSIISKDFLFLVISLIGLFFFFHPVFYEPQEVKVILNQEGVFVNNKKYSWDEIIGFEIFKIGDRYYIYFVPKHIFSIGATVPLEDYIIDIEELRRVLKTFLDEYEEAVPKWELIYRRFLK